MTLFTKNIPFFNTIYLLIYIYINSNFVYNPPFEISISRNISRTSIHVFSFSFSFFLNHLLATYPNFYQKFFFLKTNTKHTSLLFYPHIFFKHPSNTHRVHVFFFFNSLLPDIHTYTNNRYLIYIYISNVLKPYIFIH